ncbi:MAG: lysophospholipase [Mycoplasma sp.]|nr:lysophospholipase [Mycoplasma sp.]
MKLEKIQLNKEYTTKLYIWDDVKKPTGVMQIVHGSAEHAKRYDDFAKFLNKNNIIVYAMDLRGHGQFAKEKNLFGFFAEKNGHKIILEDINMIGKIIKNKYPDLKYTLLGHSMGSFVVRNYASEYDDIDNLIVVGTNHNPKLVSYFALLVLNLTILFKGKKNINKLINNMSYKSFNKKIKNAKTDADWISVNQKNIDNFVKDDLCGFTFTNQGFKDMFNWILNITKAKKIKNVSDNLKILFISGTEDPVGKNGSEVIKAHKNYKKYEKKANIKLYENMRHEILNETEKQIVYDDILKFIL